MARLPADDLATQTASGQGSLSTNRALYTRHTERAIVLVLLGPDQGSTAGIGPGGAVIGSSPECDLPLTDPSVSKRHLSVAWHDRSLILTDLGSKNGSFLGDRRFEREAVALGTEFRLGKSLLKVVPEEESLRPEPNATQSLGALVGASPEMRRVFALIDMVAPTEATVLLEGETGTGKELVAEEIHRRSPRRDGPFVVFDAGAVPAPLVESLLFGHVRGAFTGAVSDKTGVLEEAHGGTLFLDEMGELPLLLQPTLLRFLDERSVLPVGSVRRRTVDVRVIAATNRQLGQMIVDGTFREDLYHRLAVVRLTLPALRQRDGDVPLLIRLFLRQAGRPDLLVDDKLLARLAVHPWPGNVRELKNFVARAVALGADEVLGLRALDSLVPPELAEAGELAPAKLKPFRLAKTEALEAFERQYLTDLIQEHSTVSAAAEAAQMDRKHLAMLLRRYELGGR